MVGQPQAVEEFTTAAIRTVGIVSFANEALRTSFIFDSGNGFGALQFKKQYALSFLTDGTALKRWSKLELFWEELAEEDRPYAEWTLERFRGAPP